MPLRKVSTLAKGEIERRIVAKVKHEGRDYALHATKGYRCKRA